MPVCPGSRISFRSCNLPGRSTALRRGPFPGTQQYTVLRSWTSSDPPILCPSRAPGVGVLSSMQKRQLFARYVSRQLTLLCTISQWHFVTSALQLPSHAGLLAVLARRLPVLQSPKEDCAAEDPERGTTDDAEELKADSGMAGLSTGQLYLAAVAALWGSYAPALR